MSMPIASQCHGTKKDGVVEVCQCMNTIVQPPGPVGGIKYLMTIDKTLTRRMRIIYGANNKIDYLLNYCPFCRGELTVEEPEEAAPCPKPVHEKTWVWDDASF